MMLPQIAVHPEKLYNGHGRLSRGARRSDGRWGRTLALLDTLGIKKRAHRIHITLSADGYAILRDRADAVEVSASGLAAYLVESAVRRERTP